MDRSEAPAFPQGSPDGSAVAQPRGQAAVGQHPVGMGLALLLQEQPPADRPVPAAVGLHPAGVQAALGGAFDAGEVVVPRAGGLVAAVGVADASATP